VIKRFELRRAEGRKGRRGESSRQCSIINNQYSESWEEEVERRKN